MTLSYRRPRGRWALIAIAVLMPVVSSASAQTLERIGSAGVFKIGFREDAPPFSYKDKAGEPVGYAVDLCREIAADVKAKLGLPRLRIEYVPVGTEDRFDAVAEGRIDILCGASTATLSRRDKVAFSIAMFHTGISPLLRSDAPAFLRETIARREPSLPPRARLLQAFEDRKFAVRSNTTAEDWLRGSINKLASNAELVTVDSHEEGLRQVFDKEIDAYFADRAILLGLVIASETPTEFIIGERLFTHEPYALAVRRGDEDFRLLVDQTLSRLYRSLEISAIYSRHFGSPGLAVLSLFAISALPE